MLGLEWHDINFETGVIHIQRTSNYTKAKGIYTDDTKTKGSNRYIKIPKDILDLLEAYRKVQANEFYELGDKYHETDRLFTKWDGRPMNPQTPYGWLKEYCEDNNFPFYGVHTFLHLNASLLIGVGIDVATVSGTLGHSNQTTTLSVYSHMFRSIRSKPAMLLRTHLNSTVRHNAKNCNKKSEVRASDLHTYFAENCFDFDFLSEITTGNLTLP